MPSDISGSLTLREDVLVIPVADLPDESRSQIDCGPDDFAVSRLQSRSGSKIIDSEAADLLSRFRKPRTVVEAVILFGKEKKLDPNQVLEDAYTFLRGMVEAGFLVPAGQSDASPNGPASIAGYWSAGATVLDAVVLKTLQVLDDTDVYLLARPNGHFSVLKVERLSAEGRRIGSAHSRLAQEAKYLAHLDGHLAPALLREGVIEERSYLELEYIPGVDAATAAAEWRSREGAEGRGKLLALAQAIAKAYSDLHERGVIHGDVHFRNIFIDSNDEVRLIDFGVANARSADGSLPPSRERGGIPFFFEPELARAYLAGSPAPPASEAGEQHAVAALIYYLVTGAHWQDFRLGQTAMLEDIATRVPLPFRERGVPSWPALEAVLGRALAKQPAERFPSLDEFTAALQTVPLPSSGGRSRTPVAALQRILERALDGASLAGPWNQSTLTPAPTTSLNYGSAGIALGLLQISQQRRDAEILALADLWTRRALQEIKGKDAFYNPEIEITPEMVGDSSPYHSPSGVFAVATLVAIARAEPLFAAQSLDRFLEVVRSPAKGLDLTLGRSSLLLGATILLDAIGSDPLLDQKPLRQFGDATLGQIWEELDTIPDIPSAKIEYLGVAHGWAGFLYATLQWCRVSRAPVPPAVERRLEELAALALPSGRGLEWPWLLNRPGEPMTMAGWCNGTCGYVFLWTLAHRLLKDPRYLDHARGAAWRAWDAPEPTVSMCCGLVGRSYALLNIYRHTTDRIWLDRARDLAARAAQGGNIPAEYPHSLYKGEFGLAVLAADIEQPEHAAMPFFEPLGYQN